MSTFNSQTGGLEQFKKLKKLGEGTYGVVYKALELRTQKFVALKRIRTDDEDEGVPSTAIREVALLKELDHPNVVKLEQVLFNRNQLFLVFEFCSNDLKKHMDKFKNKLRPEQIRSYVHQTLKALYYCHERRVLHRDLKPQNILIDEESGRIKLADFGLARTYSLPNKTWTHEVITLWYRPPEILLGCREYNVEVDIWGVGCIAAELFNCSPLFRGDSQISQIMHIFKMLGTPNNKSWPNVNKLKDFQSSFPKWTPKPWPKIVPKMNDLGHNLMSKMLALDPLKRVTTKQALKHPYFHGL